ncbi:MAG: NUDIX domain-containing protein [Patescibacteria group bacterium]
MNKTIGIGVMLQTPNFTYLLQERDHNTHVSPGRIAPFGGGIENNETVEECAVRELKEELDLDIDQNQLETIGLIESKRSPGLFLHMFLLRGVEKKNLSLNEGNDIVELTSEQALENPMVTDFTKNVLKLLNG